jgi:hypothetical protein
MVYGDKLFSNVTVRHARQFGLTNSKSRDA